MFSGPRVFVLWPGVVQPRGEEEAASKSLPLSPDLYHREGLQGMLPLMPTLNIHTHSLDPREMAGGDSPVCLIMD